MNHQYQAPPQSDTENLLLVIIAVLVPWAAILVMKGCNSQTLLCFILTTLFYIPGLIYALYLIKHEKGTIRLAPAPPMDTASYNRKSESYQRRNCGQHCRQDSSGPTISPSPIAEYKDEKV